MRIRTEKIHSLPEYVAWVERVEAASTTPSNQLMTPWFRGVGSAKFDLIPGLYRREDTRDLLLDLKLRREFRRLGMPMFAGGTGRNQWEWYFLMQHYRMPTRLLDWTDAALFALYFALASAVTGARPCVWALNPWRLNELSTGFRTVYRCEDLLASPDVRLTAYLCDEEQRLASTPELPVALLPTLVDSRMAAQHSYFTVHGKEPLALNKMVKLKGLIAEGSLQRAVIEVSDVGIRSMRVLLGTCGIVETTLFPDLEGLSREIVSGYIG